MKEWGLKGSSSDEDFIIHVRNNIPMESDDIILDRFDNHHIKWGWCSNNTGNKRKIKPQVQKINKKTEEKKEKENLSSLWVTVSRHMQ